MRGSGSPDRRARVSPPHPQRTLQLDWMHMSSLPVVLLVPLFSSQTLYSPTHLPRRTTLLRLLCLHQSRCRRRLHTPRPDTDRPSLTSLSFLPRSSPPLDPRCRWPDPSPTSLSRLGRSRRNRATDITTTADRRRTSYLPSSLRRSISRHRRTERPSIDLVRHLPRRPSLGGGSGSRP